MHPHKRFHRKFNVMALAGLLALALAPAALTASATAEPAQDPGCSVADFDAGTCLMGIQTPGVSPLTAAVQAAIRSGRGDVVDKFAAQPGTPESVRTEIATARVNVSPVLEVIDQHSTPPPDPGIVVPFGGNDGVTDTYTWDMNQSRPIVRCESAGCYQIDIIDISFHLDLYTNNVAILTGEFTARDLVGTFGVKNFTCEVKKDRALRRDPPRGSFSGCKGVPRTSHFSVLESTVSHNYYNEDDWLNIKFESYDANIGLSMGTVEYKSPNWRKTGTGDQHF